LKRGKIKILLIIKRLIKGGNNMMKTGYLTTISNVEFFLEKSANNNYIVIAETLAEKSRYSFKNENEVKTFLKDVAKNGL
jgi:hypothetical protein